MQRFFSFVYGWIKALDFISGWCKCVTIEHSVIWVKTYVFSTFNKKEDFSRLNLFPEWFFYITDSCWPPDSDFTMCKCTLFNILRFWIKRYCWHFWVKSHFGILCGVFCNITFSFLLILTTVFKSNPKRLSISFYIPFVTWKMHFKHFWPKITIKTLLA